MFEALTISCCKPFSIETDRGLVILLQTANCGLQLTVSRYPSAHISDLRFGGGSSLRSWGVFVFTHPLTSILAENLSSKSLFFFQIKFDDQWAKKLKKVVFLLQTWDCDFFTVRKTYISLTSGAWSSRTNVNLKSQTWRSRDFLTFSVRGKCRKTSILRSLLKKYDSLETLNWSWPAYKVQLIPSEGSLAERLGRWNRHQRQA